MSFKKQQQNTLRPTFFPDFSGKKVGRKVLLAKNTTARHQTTK
jgi:hypothetical protein